MKHQTHNYYATKIQTVFITDISFVIYSDIFGKSWKLAATLRWFTAGGAIRIAVRQLSQTWKLRHYDVIDVIISRKL